MERAINAIKDSYVWVIDNVVKHPHAATWAFIGVAVFLLVWR